MARILFSIGSDAGDKLKRWPWWNWINLARLCVINGHQVGFLGTAPDEVPSIETPSYRSLKLVLSSANVVVCNDNGIMHVADYLGVPTIALFGPTSTIKNIPINGIAIKGNCPKGKKDGCYKNGKIECGGTKHRATTHHSKTNNDIIPCLAAITPAKVFEQIAIVLRRRKSNFRPPTRLFQLSDVDLNGGSLF